MKSNGVVIIYNDSEHVTFVLFRLSRINVAYRASHRSRERILSIALRALFSGIRWTVNSAGIRG